MNIAEWLASQIDTPVFSITGGGAMYLNDAFRNHAVYMHHEQACAYAAEGFFRASNKMPTVVVTSGPGGINTLSGVFGQWTDSIPVLYISGNVRTPFLSKPPLRQLGDQEARIIELVTPITKYAVCVTDPKTIRYHLERAIFEAFYERPGPVWLDIPLDVQNAEYEEQLGFFNCIKTPAMEKVYYEMIAKDINKKLSQAKRPIILAGSATRGIQLEHLDIPIALAWNAKDLLPYNHRLNAGITGSIGEDCGNWALANADLVLSLGCRMNLRQTGYGHWTDAEILAVDIDEAELNKPSYHSHKSYRADIKKLIPLLKPAEGDWLETRYTNWIQEIHSHQTTYPTSIFDNINYADTIILANGAASVDGTRYIKIKKGQKLITNSGCAAMGYALPAAIGAAVATGEKVTCIEGDGSIMMNIQELGALNHYPIDLYILDNGGYWSITQTQERYFGRRTGDKPDFPDWNKLKEAFNVNFTVINYPRIPFKKCLQ